MSWPAKQSWFQDILDRAAKEARTEIRKVFEGDRFGKPERQVSVKETEGNGPWTPAMDPRPRPSHWPGDKQPPGSADASATHVAEKSEALPEPENQTLSDR